MSSKFLRILLIADDHADYIKVEQLLAVQQREIRLDWCCSTEQAIPAVAEETHDIFLIDYSFDKNQVQQLVQEAKASACTSPIILLDDDYHPDNAVALVDMGASAYLNKQSLDAASLKVAIEQAFISKEKELNLDQLAHYDTLTGVANRQLLRDRLDLMLRRAELHQGRVCLMLLDINGFKHINASVGHEVADQLIIAVVKRLQDTLRKTDGLARLGGDQLAVAFDSIGDTKNAARVADKVLESLSKPFLLANKKLTVTFSLGLAISPNAGKHIDQLFKHAEIAMDQAKETDGNKYEFYTEKLAFNGLNKKYLAAELRRALANNEFVLHYQPRIDLKTNTIIGTEALIRWQHPDRGLLAPDEFIPVAEETGIIIPMGYWIIDQACKDLKYMHARGVNHLTFAINMSFRQFHDEKLVTTVKNIIDRHKVDTQLLEIELTETAMMQNQEETADRIRSLNKIGLNFSLDDFGTGYSSFALIQRLPIDSLKIDKSFVRNIDHNKDDAQLVMAMINLAHNLNMSVIAEGVETVQQADYLKNNNCDQAQGFLYSKAIVIKELLGLVLSNKHAVMEY